MSRATRTPTARRWRRRLLLALALTLAGAAVAASRHPRVLAVFASRADFAPHPTLPRLWVERGAESDGEAIAAALPAAERRVLAALPGPFRAEFRVYVCATQASCNRVFGDPAGGKSRGAVFLGDVYIAPRAFNAFGRDTHAATLAHELAHLHLQQAIGIRRSLTEVPRWFHEGLADVVAGSGGEGIDDGTVGQALARGQHFSLRTDDSALRPYRPSDDGLTYPMLHAQSRRFTDFLRTRAPAAFDRLLARLYAGDDFAAALLAAYSRDLPTLWDDFLAQRGPTPSATPQRPGSVSR